MIKKRWNQNVKETALRVFKTFTWEMLVAAVITVLALLAADSHLDSKISEELLKFILAFSGLFFALLGFRGISHERIAPKIVIQALLIWVLFAWLLLWYFKKPESFVIYILISVIFALVWPFLFINLEKFEGFVLKMVNALNITLLYGVVIQLGISMIYSSLRLLFDLQTDFYYIRSSIILLCFVVPGIFLAYFPTQYEDIEREKSRIKEILFLYIVIPILALYVLIIYIYFAKILLTLRIPLNEITWLILAFLLSGFIGLVLLRGLEEIKEDAFSKIQKAYLIAGTPLLFLFAFSLIERLRLFGFTEPRYTLLLFLIWSIAVFVMIVFKRPKQEMLALAAILALVSSGGILGMSSISNFSQEKRLTGIMDKYSISSDGLKHAAIPDSDKREVSEILKYFSQKTELDKLSHKIKTINAQGKKVTYYKDTVFYKNLELAAADNAVIPGSNRNISFYAEKSIYLTQSEIAKSKAVIILNHYFFDQKNLNEIPDEMKKYDIMTDDLLAQAVYDKKAQLYIDGKKVENLTSFLQDSKSSEIKIVMTYPAHENIYYLKSITGNVTTYIEKKSLRIVIALIQVKSLENPNRDSDEPKDVKILNK